MAKRGRRPGSKLPPRKPDERDGCVSELELAQRIAAAGAAKRNANEVGFDAREPYALRESGGHAIQSHGSGEVIGYALSGFLANEARFAELESASNEPAYNESGLWQRSDYGTERVAWNKANGYYDYWTDGERD